MSIKKILCIGAVFVIVMSAVVYEKRHHDLSGTYYTCDFFPVKSIAFSGNGTFMTDSEYEVLQGKYSKKGDTYLMQFTNGKSKSSNPVSNYEAASTGSQYELEAEKIGDGHLRVYVIPKISYWAWFGKYADFYEGGLDVALENEPVNEPENDIGRPPEEDCIDNMVFDLGATYVNDESDEYVYRYTHNDMGNLTEKTEYYNGNICSRTEYEYDADNNLKAENVYDSSNNILNCEVYDKKGNVIESKAYGGGEVYQCYGYEYDDAGNLIKKELQYGSSEGGPTVLKYEYDEIGNMVKCMRGWNDTNGNFIIQTQEGYEYDIARNLLRKVNYYFGNSDLGIEPSEQRCEYEYEDNGKLVREICFDTSGNITNRNEAEYDDIGNKVKEIYYDSDGNITKQIKYTYIFQ